MPAVGTTSYASQDVMDEMVRLRAALARIRNIASDEVETIYAARGLLRAIETVAAQALGEK